MGAQTSHSSYPPEAEQEDKITNSPSKADSSPIQGRNLDSDFVNAKIVNSPSDPTKMSPLRPRMIETEADTPSGDRERNGTLVGKMKERYLDARAAADKKRKLHKKDTPFLEWLNGKKKYKTTKLRL